MKDFKQEFWPDMKEFRDVTNRFYQGELTTAQYKNISGGFGSYAQRGGKRGMLRLRLCGGRITKDSLRFIADSIEKYQIDRIHFTTCQTVQLHNLTAETICSLIEEAWEHGIITRGGGGNYPRNVMVSPLTGAAPEDFFDLMPYAAAASEYLLGLIHTVKLPRKLKVCFTGSIENEPHATFRDLGFVANQDGTFAVYSAGGLGNNPKMGVCVAEQAAAEDVLYYIKAMVDTFTSYGNYENRARARTRYMQDTFGPEGYRNVFLQKLEQVMHSEQLKISVHPEIIHKQGDGTISHPRVTAQKQPGLYAVYFHPIGGCPNPAIMRRIYDTIVPMKDVELRLTPDEGVYFIHCTASEAETLLQLTDDGARNSFEASTACIGNHICQIGLRDSQALLKSCIDAVRPCGFAEGVLPRLHISGCPSSCGTHPIGSIGFRGAVKQTKDGPKAAFALFTGGCAELGKEKFGEELCVMTEENIPKFLIELGHSIANDGETFENWIQKNQEKFLKIAETYAG